MLCALPNMQHLSNWINYFSFHTILSFLEYYTLGVQIFCVDFLDSAKANGTSVTSMTSAHFSHSIILPVLQILSTYLWLTRFLPILNLGKFEINTYKHLPDNFMWNNFVFKKNRKPSQNPVVRLHRNYT